jgi:hypothetical protein
MVLPEIAGKKVVVSSKMMGLGSFLIVRFAKVNS